MILPQTGTWRSIQNSEYAGDIVASRNVDLSHAGAVMLSNRAMTLFSYGSSFSSSAGEDSSFQGTFLGGVTDTQYAYLLSTTNVHVMNLTDTLLPSLAAPSSNAPTYGFDSDICMFQGLPHVSGGQYVSSLNLGFSTWAGRQISGLSTTVPHPLCVVEQLNQLAVGNGNTVKTYNTSYSLQTTLTLPSEYIVTTMRWRQNNLYIGTRHQFGGNAKLFIWNGSGTSAQFGFNCGADWIYSLEEYVSRMCAVTSAGQLRSFNGGGFDDLAAFPVYYTPYNWTSTNGAGYLVGKVTNRGMCVDGSTLFINIDGSINNGAGVYPGQYLPNQPSGLWQLIPGSGLVHRAAPNFSSRLRLTPTALSSGYLTFGTAHQANTGDAVLASPSSLTGLTAGQVYYAIVDSTTTLRLALSPADALNGRAIAIGGNIGSDNFVFDRYETLGWGAVGYAGGVLTFGRTYPSPFYGTEVIFGAGRYDTGLGLYRATVCGLGMGRNRGYFVTPKIRASGAADRFDKLNMMLAPLRLTTDQVIVKERSRDRFGLPTPPFFTGTATWTSSTTFTVDSTKYDFKSVVEGDEIEVISGDAAGYLAHITVIDKSSTTYTVTIDETMPVSSGTFDFIADNWTKKGTFTSSSPENFRGTGKAKITDKGSWVQFKIELRGRGAAIRSLEPVVSAGE